MKFLEALALELEALRDNRDSVVLEEYGLYGYYGLLEVFNLGKYANSELAWTMNTNNSLSSWRITVR